MVQSKPANFSLQHQSLRMPTSNPLFIEETEIRPQPRVLPHSKTLVTIMANKVSHNEASFALLAISTPSHKQAWPFQVHSPVLPISFTHISLRLCPACLPHSCPLSWPTHLRSIGFLCLLYDYILIIVTCITRKTFVYWKGARDQDQSCQCLSARRQAMSTDQPALPRAPDQKVGSNLKEDKMCKKP